MSHKTSSQVPVELQEYSVDLVGTSIRRIHP